MKKIIALIITAIVGVCVFSACSVLPEVLGAVFEPGPEKDWANKAILNELMNHPTKQLLIKTEKFKAAKAICELKYIQNPRKDLLNKYEGKKFCKLEKEDEIYFLKEIMEWNGMVSTEYLLVRDGKPFTHVEIERRLDSELNIERLH